MRIPTKPPSLQVLIPKHLQEYASETIKPEFVQSETKKLLGQAEIGDWNWDDVRHRSSSLLAAERLWMAIKIDRSVRGAATPILDRTGRPFSWRLTSATQRFLRQVDLRLGGPKIKLGADEEKKRYLVSSLTEEAIASSQIEGAATTRVVAKEMIRTNRDPKTIDERMILNNYRAMQRLKEWMDQQLSSELLFEIQSVLTEGTLKSPDQVGRLRLKSEEITVWDDEDQQTLHVPPPAEQLPERLEKLFAFANAVDQDDDSLFIHPAVKAAVLHFWLAYEHPFVDGNGRTARAIFYWSMLRAGYWLAEYLTISTIIRGHPHQYARAFLNTEIDDNDLTYFINYHLKVNVRAIEELDRHVDRKREERLRLTTIVGPAAFNKRQQALLAKALEVPSTVFTYESHASSHGVGLMTARSDLLDLERRRFLLGNRVGRRFEFVAVEDLLDRLKKIKKETP